MFNLKPPSNSTHLEIPCQMKPRVKALQSQQVPLSPDSLIIDEHYSRVCGCKWRVIVSFKLKLFAEEQNSRFSDVRQRDGVKCTAGLLEHCEKNTPQNTPAKQLKHKEARQISVTGAAVLRSPKSTPISTPCTPHLVHFPCF